MRELLRDRDFRLLFAGQTLSMFGDMAMLLVLAMWAKDLTGSNGIAGSVFAALVVPSLLAPLAGVVIDRFRRRTVMIVTDLATAAVVLLLLLVDGREDLWLLYLVAFCYGASLVAFSSARSALLPAMVDEDLLGPANGSLGTGREALRLVAPLAGAALYAGFGGPAVAILDAATFLVSAAALLALRVDEPAPEPHPGSFTVEAAAGGRHLLGDPVLRTTVVATVICMLALGISESVYFAIVDEGLGRPVEFIGVLSAVQGVGAILAGVAITGVIRRTGELRPMAWGFAALAVGVALTTTGRLGPVAVGVLLFGAGLPVLIVCMTTAIQRRTPPGLQGRAFTAFELFAGVPQLLSILGGAVAVTLVDYRIPLTVMGLGLAAAGVYSWRQLREEEVPLPDQDPSVLPDPAGVDVHVPLGADVVQQPPVVGDEQEGPVVRR